MEEQRKVMANSKYDQRIAIDNNLVHDYFDDIDIDIYADAIEAPCLSQLRAIVNTPAFEHEQIRIMPDVHSSHASVVGFTSTIRSGLVVPNIVGGDIGCGVLCVPFKARKGIDFAKLDKTIRSLIPSSVGRMNDAPRATFDDKNQLVCWSSLPSKDYIDLSLGTLGGSNHFIEVDRAQVDGTTYLSIHTGSRNFGTTVAKWWQQRAYDIRLADPSSIAVVSSRNIADFVADDMTDMLQPNASQQHGTIRTVPFELCWLDGDDALGYLHDMQICCEYARTNRRIIADTIMKAMKWKRCGDDIDTMHNYIDTDVDGIDAGLGIVRKGAVSARSDERFVVPMNMSDGILMCIGKGNDDWNMSAPHGAGRLMSRKDARNTIAMSEYKKSMKDVWSTSVSNLTVDEAPQAYKPMDEIVSKLSDTCDIVDRLSCLYNFKAEEMPKR